LLRSSEISVRDPNGNRHILGGWPATRRISTSSSGSIIPFPPVLFSQLDDRDFLRIVPTLLVLLSMRRSVRKASATALFVLRNSVRPVSNRFIEPVTSHLMTTRCSGRRKHRGSPRAPNLERVQQFSTLQIRYPTSECTALTLGMSHADGTEKCSGGADFLSLSHTVS